MKQNGLFGSPAARPPSNRDQVLSVFEHYRSYHPRAFRAPQSDSPEYRKIAARLKEGYTVNDLKEAIDGNHRSPWHCGENPGNKEYHSLELIMRSGSHVESFRMSKIGAVVLTEKSMRTHRAGDEFLKRRSGP